MAPDVESKVWNKHQLTHWEVADVVVASESERRWDIDPIHGGRLLIRGHTPSHRPVFVALAPTEEEGTWSCITAFVPSGEHYLEDDDD